MDWFLYDIGLRHERVNLGKRRLLKLGRKGVFLFIFIIFITFCEVKQIIKSFQRKIVSVPVELVRKLFLRKL